MGAEVPPLDAEDRVLEDEPLGALLVDLFAGEVDFLVGERPACSGDLCFCTGFEVGEATIGGACVVEVLGCITGSDVVLLLLTASECGTLGERARREAPCDSWGWECISLLRDLFLCTTTFLTTTFFILDNASFFPLYSIPSSFMSLET